DAGAGRLGQLARAGARARRQDAVLDEEKRDLVLRGDQLRCQVAAKARVVRIERVARLDQEISRHRAPPSCGTGDRGLPGGPMLMMAPPGSRGKGAGGSLPDGPPNGPSIFRVAI